MRLFDHFRSDVDVAVRALVDVSCRLATSQFTDISEISASAVVDVAFREHIYHPQ